MLDFGMETCFILFFLNITTKLVISQIKFTLVLYSINVKNRKQSSVLRFLHFPNQPRKGQFPRFFLQVMFQLQQATRNHVRLYGKFNSKWHRKSKVFFFTNQLKPFVFPSSFIKILFLSSVKMSFLKVLDTPGNLSISESPVIVFRGRVG